jgi:ABC-2 family transporter protein
MNLRASQLLRIRKLWIVPIVIVGIVVALTASIYFGSVVDPVGHMHGLPVMVVDQDSGPAGGKVVAALRSPSPVTSRLNLQPASLQHAQDVMDRGGAFATLVIPANFSTAPAHVQVLENSRLGSLGVNLAVGVLTPAMAKISPKTVVTPTQYRPLPSHSALGLSAFYVSLLAIMAGFLAATVINSSIDGAFGYATTELGARWSQRRPLPVNRRQTLLTKWAVAVVAAPILTAIVLVMAVGVLGMYAPNVVELWLLLTLAAMMVSFGTLALLAAFGSVGQMLAMVLLVYLSLASSGGTVPIDALPGLFKVVGHVEPLRNVLAGARAIVYFGGRGDAGLTSSVIVIALELVFWAAVGFGVTSWYDHRKLYRLSPEMLEVVHRAIDERLTPAGAGAAVD